MFRVKDESELKAHIQQKKPTSNPTLEYDYINCMNMLKTARLEERLIKSTLPVGIMISLSSALFIAYCLYRILDRPN